MKIVIDIPETFYEDCKRFAEYNEADKYIANGTPLPKGHGRLIDADALLEKLGMLGVSNAYDRPSFWYGKDKKDYKVIPTKYHNGYDNALADVEKAIQELPTIEERKTDTCTNDGKEYAEVDQFVCSACGIELQDWHRVERDMDDGEVSYHEYTFRFCPNCGRRIVEGADNE